MHAYSPPASILYPLYYFFTLFDLTVFSITPGHYCVFSFVTVQSYSNIPGPSTRYHALHPNLGLSDDEVCVTL